MMGQMMTNEDMGLQEVKALVAFGRLGLAIIASRMLSMLALVGVLALGGYTVYSNSWQGVAVTAIVAWFVFRLALRSETRPDTRDGG